MRMKRIAMDVIEEVLRMWHECGLSRWQIPRAWAVVRGVQPVAAGLDAGGSAVPSSADLDAEWLPVRLCGLPPGRRRDVW